MAETKIDKKSTKSQSSSEESSSSDSERETNRNSTSKPQKPTTKRKRATTSEHAPPNKRSKSSHCDISTVSSSSDDSSSDSASDHNEVEGALKSNKEKSRSGSASEEGSSSESSAEGSENEQTSKTKDTPKPYGQTNGDKHTSAPSDHGSDSSSTPSTPRPYQPPPGFEKVPKNSSKTNTIADLLDPSKLAAEGKELWCISAPAALPMQSIKFAELDKPKKGHISMSHGGVDYLLRAEEGSIDPYLMTSSDGGASYKLGMCSSSSFSYSILVRACDRFLAYISPSSKVRIHQRLHPQTICATT